MKQPTPFGKYLLLERISVGGMAEVFRAKPVGAAADPSKGVGDGVIAIKKILPSMAEDADFITMFTDEARIAGQLDHQHIARIFELGRVDDTHFIAMEFVWGKDVLQMQNRFRKLKQKMSFPMAAFVASKMCAALDYAHKKADVEGKPLAIIHRDVSPQNVLVSYEGEIKVIDFGIAKAASRSTRTQAGVLKGKFGYMSPEQVSGLPLDHRSDVFAIGTILYELLTADRLFLGESDFATLEKVRNVDVPKPSEAAPGCPAELERIILKALARDVGQRYQWAADMERDLDAFLSTLEPRFMRGDLSAWMKEQFASEMKRESDSLDEQLRAAATAAVGADKQPPVDEAIATGQTTQMDLAELAAGHPGFAAILGEATTVTPGPQASAINRAITPAGAEDPPTVEVEADPPLAVQATQIFAEREADPGKHDRAVPSDEEHAQSGESESEETTGSFRPASGVAESVIAAAADSAPAQVAGEAVPAAAPAADSPKGIVAASEVPAEETPPPAAAPFIEGVFDRTEALSIAADVALPMAAAGTGGASEPITESGSAAPAAPAKSHSVIPSDASGGALATDSATTGATPDRATHADELGATLALEAPANLAADIAAAGGRLIALAAAAPTKATPDHSPTPSPSPLSPATPLSSSSSPSPSASPSPTISSPASTDEMPSQATAIMDSHSLSRLPSHSGGGQVGANPGTSHVTALPYPQKAARSTLVTDVLIGVAVAAAIVVGVLFWRGDLQRGSSTGTLVVTLHPSDTGQVWVDGEPRGVVQPGKALTIKDVAAGAHQVRVRSSSGELEESVTIAAGEVGVVNALLAPAKPITVEAPAPPEKSAAPLAVVAAANGAAIAPPKETGATGPVEQAAKTNAANGEKNPPDEKKPADQKTLAEEKKAADHKKAAEDKQAAEDQKAAAVAEGRAAAEKKAADDKKAAEDKKVAAAEVKKAAADKKAAAGQAGAQAKQAIPAETASTIDGLGHLSITSDPPGADINVNGKPNGQTPAEIDGIAREKAVRITVRKSGFAGAVRYLSFDKEPRQVLDVKFASDGKSAAATDGSKATANDKSAGSTAVAAAKADKSGAARIEKAAAPPAANLKSGDTPGAGYLIANTTPWARVFVDDKDTGASTPIAPQSRLVLKPGKHVVTFVAKGHKYKFDVDIKTGETTRMSKVLEDE